MQSIKNDQFNQPLAENQEEYNTLFINLNTEDPLCPATVLFQFSPKELAVLNANEGKFYYQQCLFRTNGVNNKGEIVKVPANHFHPMSIHITNPLESHQEDNKGVMQQKQSFRDYVFSSGLSRTDKDLIMGMYHGYERNIEMI